MNNYIFDLDGTIVDSSDEVISCLRQAYKLADYKVDESRLNTGIMGPPLKKIIELVSPELTDENKITEIVSHYRKLYDNNLNDVSKLYDGINDFLIEAKNSGSKLFIATFKPILPTMRIIKMFNLDIFDGVYSVDSPKTYKNKTDMINDIVKTHSLEIGKTYMIGDIDNDINAANNAGVISIGALWGYGSDKSYLKENAKYVINHINELKCLK